MIEIILCLGLRRNQVSEAFMVVGFATTGSEPDKNKGRPLRRNTTLVAY